MPIRLLILLVLSSISSSSVLTASSFQASPLFLLFSRRPHHHSLFTMATCSAPGKCAPCEGLDNSALLSTEVVQERLKENPLWTLVEATPESSSADADNGKTQKPMTLSRKFTAKNFQAALDSINAMGAIAEEQGHHPDFHLTSYRNVEVTLWTHSLGGITENDFTLAQLLDQVPVTYSPKWLRENPAAQQKEAS